MKESSRAQAHDTTYGMPTLFALPEARPIVVEHTIKAEHLEGKSKRGRPRNYREVKDMMSLCKSITYTLKKNNEEVMSLCCYVQRTAWEASQLTTDLLKRRIADECTIKYEH